MEIKNTIIKWKDINKEKPKADGWIKINTVLHHLSYTALIVESVFWQDAEYEIISYGRFILNAEDIGLPQEKCWYGEERKYGSYFNGIYWSYIDDFILPIPPEPSKPIINPNDDTEKKYTLSQLRKAWGAGFYKGNTPE